MLKKYLYGAAVAAALSGAVSAPTTAEELYVRNRLFKDAFFVGAKTYVPVEGFLRAAQVEWSLDGPQLVVGSGSSPDLSSPTEQFTARNNGEQLNLTGIVRNGRLYVPAKELAEFVGYSVVYNQDTGIVDVVKGRLTSDMDIKAAKDLADAQQAQKEARDAARKARQEEAERKAKAAAAKVDGKEASDDGDSNEQKLAAKGNPDKDPSDTKTQAIDGKDDKALQSYEDEQSRESEDSDVTETDKPPAKADVLVLSSEAVPNNYTGEVQFRAVLQNQGTANATDVTANFSVVGPDGQTWVKKTLYHGPIKPDGRWEIVENYRHRLGAAIPRGNYDVKVVPAFKSEPTE